MKNLNITKGVSTPEIGEKAPKALSNKLKMAAAAIALAALNSTACGGAEFTGLQEPVNQDAAQDSKNDTLTPDSGNDANTDSDATPDSDTGTGSDENAAPDGPICNKVSVEAVNRLVIQSKPARQLAISV